MKKLQVEMTLEQARVINQALDLFSRVYMGQLENITTMARMFDINAFNEEQEANKWEHYETASYYMGKVKEELGFNVNSSWGIYSPECNQVARDAWDIQQVLRYYEAWVRDGFDPNTDVLNTSGKFQVQYNEPTMVKKENMINVTVKD